MAYMTWNEFKQFVDTQIAEQGLDGDVTVWFIGVSYPTPKGMDRPEVSTQTGELTVVT